MKRHAAYTLLAGLKVGEQVDVTIDGRNYTVTVQRALMGGDGGGFGSWDYASVTVGYGPGRWNTEISAAGIEAGRFTIQSLNGAQS